MRVSDDPNPIYTFGYIDESATSKRYFGWGKNGVESQLLMGRTGSSLNY